MNTLITKSDLLSRGWSARLIDKHLVEPDELSEKSALQVWTPDASVRSEIGFSRKEHGRISQYFIFNRFAERPVWSNWIAEIRSHNSASNLPLFKMRAKPLRFFQLLNAGKVGVSDAVDAFREKVYD